MSNKSNYLVRIRIESREKLRDLVKNENLKLPPKYKEITQEDFLSDLIDSEHEKMKGDVYD